LQGLTGTASNFLCITLNTDCPPPELRIQTGFPHSPWNILADVQVMTFRRSENVHLFADVIRRKCLEMFENGTFDFSWHVFDESSLLTFIWTNDVVIAARYGINVLGLIVVRYL